jgi:hypothetical protein
MKRSKKSRISWVVKSTRKGVKRAFLLSRRSLKKIVAAFFKLINKGIRFSKKHFKHVRKAFPKIQPLAPIAALLILALLIPSTAVYAAQTLKFSATVTPSTVTIGATQSYTVIITNDLTSDKEIKSGAILIPSGLATTSNSISISGDTGTTWDATFLTVSGTNYINFSIAPGGGSGIEAGEHLDISFGAVAMSGTGSFTLTTDSALNNSFVPGAGGGDFTNTSSAPTITIVTPPTNHTITVTATNHGLVNPSGAVSVGDGNDQAFTITPDTNYEVDDVLVDGASVGPVLTYTFTNVTADHTLGVTFAAVPVIDTIAPTIASHLDITEEATGPSGAVVSYVSPGVTDDTDPPSTAICAPLSGSTFALGDTLVTCNASDGAGNLATPVTFTITVEDTTAPTISLLGSDPVIIAQNSTYVDAGATAADLVDGNLTTSIVVVNPVNTAVAGTSTVTYNVSDAAGNAAAQVTRTVVVTPAPLVIILGCTDPAATNYTLSANTDDGSCVYPPTIYTLTYSAGANGSITGTSPQAISSGSSGTVVTAVADTGYHFVNWSDASTSASRIDTNFLSNNTYTANFAANIPAATYFTLSYVAGANGTITGSSTQTLASGTTGSAVTAMADSGFHFDSWDDGITADTRTDIASSSLTFTAIFATTTTGGTTSSGGSSGGGGGSRNGQVLGNTTTDGEVLGASCSATLTQNLRAGSSKNDASQVTRLQEFLVNHGFGSFAPTGFFGPQTIAAVRAFQAKYASDILAPWNITEPTGLVYLTTTRMINLLSCTNLEIPMPELVPWNFNPAAQ